MTLLILEKIKTIIIIKKNPFSHKKIAKRMVMDCFTRLEIMWLRKKLAAIIIQLYNNNNNNNRFNKVLNNIQTLNTL